MKQTDNVIFINRQKSLIDDDGNVDEALDEISRHFLLSYAHDLQEFGVVDLSGALALIRDGVLKFEEWSGDEAYFNTFTVVKMAPEYVRCYENNLEELEFIPIINETDPYLRPVLEEAPESLKFDKVYLMTKERLSQELKTGDKNRLVYKTPYRAEKVEEMMELTRIVNV